MTDLTPARAAGPTGFADTEWREIVVQNETLRNFAATVGVDVLRFFDWRERHKRERLGFAALENRRAMRAREHADFAGDLPQILITAAIHAFLFFENAFSKCFLLHVIERLRNRERVGLGMFFT